MALKLYFDAACTQPVTDLNPDRVHKAANVGMDLVDEKPLWIKSDNIALTYEKAYITAEGDNNTITDIKQVDVQYSLDLNGAAESYKQLLEFLDGQFVAPLKIWRKVTSPNMQQAFKRTDITHYLYAEEFMV